MKIIFFGSGDFALPIAKKLHDAYTLSAIVVVKAKPKGRGLRAGISKIVKWAYDYNVDVLEPDDPNTKIFIRETAKRSPDLFVLTSYGHILTKELLDIPRLGSINIHPSLLPNYRGAAPIQRAIMAGEKKTGITVFFMDEKIDHGDIIFQEAMAIQEDDNYGSLFARLSARSTEIIIDLVKSIESGSYKRVQQEERVKNYAPKIKKEEMFIDWHNDTAAIINLIRALSPQPGARTTFRDAEIKIIRARTGNAHISPGGLYIDKKSVSVGTNNGSIIIDEIKPPGRRLMSGLDFKNGFRIKEGEFFK